MKTIYYCLVFNDGIKQFLSKQIPDNLSESILDENKLNESYLGLRKTITFNSRDEWEYAKKNDQIMV